jgi:hypothetical protein
MQCKKRVMYCCVTDRAVGVVQNETDAYRKIRLRVEDVQGRNCLTNFWVRQLTSLETCDIISVACFFSKSLDVVQAAVAVPRPG